MGGNDISRELLAAAKELMADESSDFAMEKWAMKEATRKSNEVEEWAMKESSGYAARNSLGESKKAVQTRCFKRLMANVAEFVEGRGRFYS